MRTERFAGRRSGVGAGLLALGLVAAACGGGSSGSASSSSTSAPTGTTQPPAAVVVLKFVSFEPGEVTIHAGQTVEWKWEDAPVVHDVTFAHFASPNQATGTWFHTFPTPGTYPYRCTDHATMTGVVDVLP
jgi:plastocyanin